MTGNDDPSLAFGVHRVMPPNGAYYDEIEGNWYAVCDGCDRSPDIGQPNEYAALDYAELTGWSVSWDYGPVYCNYCNKEG